MENFDPGLGFYGPILLLALAKLVLRTALSVGIAYALAQWLTPTTGSLMGWRGLLSGQSKHDFFAFSLAWMVIAIFVSGLSFLLLDQFLWFGEEDYTAGKLGYLEMSLLGLTLWRYDRNLVQFKRKPLWKAILQGEVFLLFSLVLAFLTYDISPGSLFSRWFGFLVSPLLWAILVFSWIRANQLREAPVKPEL